MRTANEHEYWLENYNANFEIHWQHLDIIDVIFIYCNKKLIVVSDMKTNKLTKQDGTNNAPVSQNTKKLNSKNFLPD